MAHILADAFHLIKDRSVYYCADYAFRFSSSGGRNFGNAVASLSRLQKYDDRPFIVCLVTPSQNYCLIANTTFLKKISHTSQELRENNIRGSFNGSDIVREFEGISTSAENIAGEDESLRRQLITALKVGNRGIPQFKTDNTLGDYHRHFDAFDTETDVKTKIRILNSNPKAYNLDKMLAFLAKDRSVFMFYFVGIDPGKHVNTVLVSMFQRDLLRSTILLRHWSGRNSRGVTQFEGETINDLIVTPDSSIDEGESVKFLKRVTAL